MKKSYTLIVAAMSVALGISAQQLPNAGFEEGWADCVPWTSEGNTKTEGKTPNSWTIAHVIGMSLGGKTSVGEKVEGYDSGSAVLIKNSPNSVAKTQTVPGYVTLGTPWNTAQGASAKNKDGGTFGGIDFPYKPDAVSFWYKRTHGTANVEEKAQIIAYLWSGTYTQKDVPGNIGLSASNIKKVEMTDRDRNILDMATGQGGEVTQKGTLVAKINYDITGDAADWTELTVPFEYMAGVNASPEKINVIFSAGDYFSTTPGVDNTLTVDSVQLVYYSRLSALKFKDVAVDGFNENKYEYNIDAWMPESADDIAYTVKGQSATASVALDKANRTATVTVVNVDSDIDGKNTHTYTLKFYGEAGVLPASTSYSGSITINGVTVEYPDGPFVHIYNGKGQENAAEFHFYDFSLDGKTVIGSIIIDNVDVAKDIAGNTYLRGAKNGIKFRINKNFVNVDATVNAVVSADKKMDAELTLLIDPVPAARASADATEYSVKFSGEYDTTVGIDQIEQDSVDAPVEVYTVNGIKVNAAEMVPGLYIRRQGNNVSKILVK
ncbi:PCMD domain-containing protein [uncultured Muribaculum sp.]|uniref:PCMD domain-containing protein n=1 Tax=uncultured Muribaculum sp. TaxID=1918613 RepID=UPI0025B17C71|nr:PCMD domain-containing protein [uncultured Muribaculum sp.]